MLPFDLVTAKKTSADGGGAGVSSEDEALEEAAVGTVGEGGGRPGPHSKQNKGWGLSGACMRRVPLGLVGCLGGGGGETEGGAGGADSLVGIHFYSGSTRREVRSRERAEGIEMRLGEEEGGGGTGEGAVEGGWAF